MVLLNRWLRRTGASVLLCAVAMGQSIAAYGNPEVNMDLGGTPKSVAAPTAGFILVDGRPMQVRPGTMLTPAEYTALAQTTSTGRQTLLVGANGAATGGYFLLNQTGQGINNLVIPNGVVGIGNAAAGAFALSGNLSNLGSVYVMSTSAVNQAMIQANNIFNARSGVISSVVPVNWASVLPGARTNISLALSALDSVVNLGTISSGANLSITAGNSIVNGETAGDSATITALGNVNLTSPMIRNSGTISSEQSNVQLAAVGNRLNVNNAGGTILAAKNIDFRTGPTVKDRSGNVVSKANLTVSGGALSANAVNITSLGGKVDVQTDSIQGGVNIDAGDVIVGTLTEGLTINKLNVTGDPIVYSAAPGVPLNLNNFSNLFKTGGDDFIALSGGDIVYTGTATVDASKTTGQGGKIVFAAGVTFGVLPPSPVTCTSCPFNITGTTPEGGSINAPSLSLKTNNTASGISLQAHAGSNSNGNVSIKDITSFGLNGANGTFQQPPTPGDASGPISITASGNVTANKITSTGGAGGRAGNAGQNGAAGGAAGLVAISGSGNISIQSIDSNGGSGGAATTGSGGAGGNVGNITINGNATTAVNVQSISAIGGNGNSGNSTGGAGGNVGLVSINGNLTGASIVQQGGGGGSAIFNGGGNGGTASGITVTGNVVPGTSGTFSITSAGGGGGNSGTSGTGGTGGSGGAIMLTGNVQATQIASTGGGGGGSGLGTNGGNGGNAGSIQINGNVNVPTIASRAGGGAAGRVGGGSGAGGNGGAITLTGSTINSSNITSQGGGGVPGQAGNVSLTFQSIPQMNITSANGAGSGGQVTLMATAGGIGGSGTPVTVSTTNLVVNSVGDVFLNSLRSVNFSGNSGTASTDFVVNVTGNVTTSPGVTITSPVNLTLTASNNIGANDTSRLQFDSQNITFKSLNTFAHAVGSVILTGNSSANNVFDLLADTNIDSAGSAPVSTKTLILTSTNGSINVQNLATADLTANATGAGQSIVLSATTGVNMVGTSTASATFDLTAAGNITASNLSLIQADQVTLTSTGGSIGASANAPIFLNATNLGANATSAGRNVFVRNSSTIIVNQNSTAGGTFSVTSASSVRTDAAITVSAKDVVFDAQGGSLLIDGTTNGTSSITFLSQDDIQSANLSGAYTTPRLILNSTAGNIGSPLALNIPASVTSLSANAPALGANVFISSPGSVDVFANSSAGGTFTLFAVNNITSSNGAKISAPTISFAVDGAIGSANNPVLIGPANIGAIANGGSVFVQSDGSVTITQNSSATDTFSIVAANNISMANPTAITSPVVQLTATSGQFSVTGTINALNSIALQSFQSITNANTGTINTALLRLTSTGGNVGISSVQRFFTSATKFSANAPNGSFFVASAGALEVVGSSTAEGTAWVDAAQIKISENVVASLVQFVTENLSFAPGKSVSGVNNVKVNAHAGSDLTVVTPGTIAAPKGTISFGGNIITISGGASLALDSDEANIVPTASVQFGASTTVSNTGDITVVSPVVSMANQSAVSVSGPTSTVQFRSPVGSELDIVLASSGTASITTAGGAVTFRTRGNNNLVLTDGTLNTNARLFLVTEIDGGVDVDSNITSTSDVTIETGEGISGVGLITANKLFMQTTDGLIGSSGQPLLTSVNSLTVDSFDDVFIEQVSGPLTLESSFSGGDFTLTTAKAVTINNLSAQGAISIIAQTEQLTVDPASVIFTKNGDILLNAADAVAGSILIGKGSQIYGATNSTTGQLVIAVGTPPITPALGTVPKNVRVTKVGGGAVFFDVNGIQAMAPTNSVSANDRNVIFSTGSALASAIKLGGDVRIVSSSFAALDSLDLSDPAVAGAIASAQQDGLLGGKLILNSGGVAIGGTVVLRPFDMFPQLTGLNVPTNVTMTMSGFEADDPLKITSNVSIGGVLQYQGPATTTAGILGVSSSLTGPGLDLLPTGTLTSTGVLNITSNNGMAIDGNLSAVNTTLATTNGSSSDIELGGSIASTAAKSSLTIALHGIGRLIADPLVTLKAATVSISSETGDLGALTLPLNITASTLALNTDSSVFANVTSGKGAVTLLSSSAGLFFSLNVLADKLTVNGNVNADGGSLLLQTQQNYGISSTPNSVLSAPSISLIGQLGNFGTATQPLSLRTASIEIVTSGSAYLNNGRAAQLFPVVGNTFSITNNGNLSVSGAVLPGKTISIVTTPGSGGDIILSSGAGSASGTTTILADGSISQLSGTTIVGKQVVVSAATGDIGSLNTSTKSLTISAPNGSAVVRNTGALTLQANVAELFSISNSGALTAKTLKGSDIDVFAAGNIILNGPVGQTGAIVDVTAFGSGNITGTGTITGSALTITSGSGNIGTGAGLKTSVDELLVQTSGKGAVAISNSSTLNSLIAQSGGNLSVTANGGMTVGNVSSANGGVKLVSKVGALDITSNASIIAGNGNVVIQSMDKTNGTINVQYGATIQASGTTATNGNVSIFIGSSAGSVAGTAPANVDVTTVAPGKVLFGKNSITAEAPVNILNANQRNIVFSTGTRPSSAITLGGLVTITAAPVSSIERDADGDDEFVIDTDEDGEPITWNETSLKTASQR